MDCWIVMAAGKLQSFAGRSYRIAVAMHGFHLPLRTKGMTALARKPGSGAAIN
jgi:hypothetical protein